MTMEGQEKRLEEEILGDARQKADHVVARATADAATAVKRAKVLNERRRNKALAQTREEAERKAENIVSGIWNEQRKMWLIRREQAIQTFLNGMLDELAAKPANATERLASLEALAEALAVKDRVTFHGRLPREQVLELMQQTDVFTMVSRGEAFGLVYLEAMAAGVLTVGSLREGIDGVIVDGENGFLIEAGDAQALSALYARLFAMNPAERLAVAKRAAHTAAAMTDTAVARRYLQDLLARA